MLAEATQWKTCKARCNRSCAIKEGQESTGKAARPTSKPVRNDCHDCRTNSKKEATNPNRSNGSGYRNWAAKNCGRWEFQRSRIAWCRLRYATCSSQYSSAPLLTTVMDSDPDAGPGRPCDEWTNCS